MRSVKVVTLVFLLGMGILTAAGLRSAKAVEGNWDTFVTFSAPVELPHMVLTPGKYEFKLLDFDGSAYVVAISDSNGKYLGAVQALPVYRAKATDNTVIKLEKRSPNLPESLLEWFYPDSTLGLEFVYPGAQRSEKVG